MEPYMIDYYNSMPQGVNVIDSLNKEYEELEEKYGKVEKELQFYKSLFEYPLNNSAIFNLRRVKQGGEDKWIDKVKISEKELRELDTSKEVEYLLRNCNPRCER
tara:strand:+ start:10376 stop:10687 length:312 start_codon:yes stop_codon:yes gene_type:complete